MNPSFKDRYSGPHPPPPPDGWCIIDGLPTELLSHIFKLGVELDTYDINPFALDDSTHIKLHQKSFQILVSHVSKLWREIAISLPTLWNDIAVDLDGNARSASHAKELAKIYFERAKEAPLDIAINLGSSSRPSGTMDRIHTYATEILRLAYRCHTRWRSFELTVPNFTFMAITLKLLDRIQAAPLLETLCLTNLSNNDYLERFEPRSFAKLRVLPFHGNTPRLEKTVLWGVHADWERSTPTLFRNLVELELAYHAHDVRPTYNQFVRLLTQSSNLRTLTLRESGPEGDIDDWTENVEEDSDPEEIDVQLPRVSLPSVKNLSLYFKRNEDYVQDLTDYLDLPSLTELTLDLVHQDDTEYFRKLATVQPNGKNILQGLNALALKDCYCTPEVIYSTLQHLENAVSLEFNFLYLHYLWMYFLIGEFEKYPSIQNPKIPCPKLETITVQGLLGPDVLAIAKGRKEAGLPLKKVLMEEQDALDEKDERELRTLVKLERFEGVEEDDDDGYLADIFQTIAVSESFLGR
ncbi:hypothetical protein QCA50_006706 [Cerrena zonata]|uniref:F-box domain-containing protein n=1 Tax=Cerrena zonata TaxID=2478898 RepID=A0AAW0GKI1_9APHY